MAYETISSIKRKYASFLSLFVIALLAVSTIVLSQKIIKPVGKPTNSEAAQDVKVAARVDQLITEQPKITALVYLTTKTESEGILSDQDVQLQRNNIRTDQQLLIDALKGMNYKVVYRYTSMPLLALEVDASTLAKIKEQKGLVERVDENKQGKSTIQQSRKVVGADVAENNGWSIPNTNTKIAVALIDAGVDSTHPFLQNKVVDGVCFGDQCPATTGVSAAVPCTWSTDPAVNCMHGTFVSGIIAGGPDGTGDRLAGIAPDVKIIAVRDVVAYGSYAQFTMANMFAALDWINSKVDDFKKGAYPYNIVAVNISFGLDANTYYQNCDDQYANNPIFKTLHDKGVAVVAATGNDGYAGYVINPACNSNVITAGSTDKTGALSSFSNTGTFLPNLLMAPGGKGEGAAAGENIKSSGAGGQYYESWGTSFAAPQVAAAYATIRALVPTASLDSITAAFKSTGTAVPDTRNGNNNGTFPLIRIDKAAQFLLGSASAIGNTSSCSGTSGTTQTCNVASTLGASTESDVKGTSTESGQVLQATTQSGKLMIATAAYRAHTNPTAQVAAMTYTCGSTVYNLSRLGGSTGRAAFTDQHAEMWYMINPPSGACSLKAVFCKEAPCVTQTDPEDRILTATVFNNIPQTDFAVDVRTAGYNYPPGSTFFNPSNTGPKGSMFVCTYSNYPNGGQNTITSTASGWRQVWGSGKILNNIQSAIGVSDPRTTDNQLVSMKWTGTQSWPWAAVCIDLKTTTPIVPTPTPTPIPKTSVNLKINGSDGPVSVKAGDSINLSWTATSANTCTASGGTWTGGKSITTGTDVLVAVGGTTTYKITCVGSATASDSVIVNGTPKMEFRVNGSQEDGIELGLGLSPTLYWNVVGATSCTATGGWSGAKATTTGIESVAPLTANTTYTLSCLGIGGTTVMSKQVTAFGTAQDGMNVKYYSDSNFKTLFGTKVIHGYDINYDLGTTGVFFPGLSKTNISIRHSTQITPAASGEHLFYFTVDDGIRAYLDDKLLVYDWKINGRHVVTGKATLVAGKHYNLNIDYFQGTGSATLIYQIALTVAPSTPAKVSYKAVDFPFDLNGGGINAIFFKDSAYTQVAGTAVFPFADQVITTSTGNPPWPGPYGYFSATFTPKATSTYSFLAKEMYINNVKKTGVLQTDGTYIVNIAMTANAKYIIAWESAKTGFVMKWKYGTLPYVPVDFTNSKPY